MRRLLAAGFAAGLAALAVAIFSPMGAAPVNALHGVFNAHVHDDYFHPTGAFVPGPGHATAQALCMGATPDATCTATVHAGDSVRWVAPAPLAVNPHSVTECTDATWTTCGAGSTAGNPIEDSGVRFQPGWPYQVTFADPGAYYYRCEVHPTTMRGVVQVNALAVGGGVEAFALGSSDGGFPYWLTAFGSGLVALAILGTLARRRLARAEAPTE